MKKRSGFQVMLRLVGLVRPLAGFMALAILLGLVGHLCAAFLTVLGGYALAGALGLEIPFSLGLLFGGVLLCLACKGWRGRCVGEAVFGFGLLFEGVTVMRSAMEPLLQSPLLRLELARVQQSPLHGLLAGVCMTLTVQSSSATVALLQSMAAQPGADGVHSLLGLTAAIPILLGDNIGTTITAVLAAIGQGRDAKRVAAAHAIFNLSGAAVCCALLQPFAALVRLCSPAGVECAVIARQIANAHTLFNVLCALVWLPLTGQMVRLVCALLPDKKRPEERL